MNTKTHQNLLPFTYTSPYFQEDRTGYLAQVRELEPIHWSDAIEAWVITRYEDCKALVRHPNTGKADRWRVASKDDEPLQLIEKVRQKMMLYQDPPEHRRIRGYVHKAFTPRIVEQLRPRIYEIMDDLLAEYTDQHEMNLVEAISYPLPIMVISQMLGVPADDWRLVRELSKDMGADFEPLSTQEDLDRTNRATVKMQDYFRDLIKVKQQHPGDDLLTNLIAVHEEAEDQFSIDDLLANVSLLLLAGHETTSSLISNGVFELLSHPAEFERLKAQPDLMSSAVTEILRYRSSVDLMGRYVLEDMDYQDTRFKQGDLILFSLAAANRDPEVFTNPDEFDIGRQEEQPVSFGHGIHYCLGAPLAKLETEITLEKLIEFMPDMQLKNPEPQWIPSTAFRGHSELYLQF